jgi:hypothetical protein
MASSFVQDNDESRRRLEARLHNLSDQDLARSTEYGWTVAALLAHLAFWDQRMVVILKRWQESGFDSSPIDPAAVNDAIKVLCHAIDPCATIELCLASAQVIDAELAALTPDLVQQIEEHCQATSTQFRLNRSLHRNDHLKDIELLMQQNR